MQARGGKAPICGIENCRSRQYDEGEDGYLYCQNGHRRGDLVIGQDEQDWTNARRTTTRKRKDDDGAEKQYKYFKGQQAVDLYLKCLQLILRHQVWFLIHEKGLPAELETVVLDLWALRILQLESQIGGRDQGYESQSQGFTTTDESESDTERESSRLRLRDKKLKSTPTLIDSLALCYLGILTLRLPVTPGDIHEWITNGNMVYKRAIKHVPPVMRDKLPAHYHAILDPNAALRHERFYTVLNALKFSFQKQYGIVWPSLNHSLLLYRSLRDLALPLELYDATIRLAGYLDYDFTLPPGGTKKTSIRDIPEAQLMSCLVVCTKLMYPFEGPQRYPKTSSEPAASAINWEDWCKHHSILKNTTQDVLKVYSAEELTNLQEKDVFSMSGDQLDQYLDFYQETFIEETRDDQSTGSVYKDDLFRLFPIGRPQDSKPAVQLPEVPGHQRHLEFVKAVHSGQMPQQVVDEKNGRPSTLRPGARYAHYRRVEDLPEQGRRFYQAAAKMGGLSLDMLVLAVFFAEKRMGKRMVKQMQQGRGYIDR